MGFDVEERKRKREERKRELEAGCERIVEQLEGMGAKRVVVFGSYGEGKVGMWSDLDLLVVMPNSRSGKDWRRVVYDEVERGTAVDFIVYNERELEETLPVSSFLRHVLRRGRVVYEKRSG